MVWEDARQDQGVDYTGAPQGFWEGLGAPPG